MPLRFFALAFSILLPTFCIANDKTIYGVNENVLIEEFNLDVQAKLDTGATTSSLSARDIELFDRDGDPWVRFSLAIENASEEKIERPIVRTSRIKRRADDFDPETDKTYVKRPVIELRVCMGKETRVIEINLTDRSRFKYPLLLGTQALQHFGALVDPSARYIAEKPVCSSENRQSGK